MFRVGRILVEAFDVHVDGEPYCTCQLKWNRFYWNDGTEWELDINTGTLTNVSVNMVALRHKRTWLGRARYEYGNQTITCNSPSVTSIVGRSDKRTLFCLSVSCHPFRKPWCEGVAIQRIPCSIPIAVVLYSFYSDDG